MLPQLISEGIAAAFDRDALPGPVNLWTHAVTPARECSLWGEAKPQAIVASHSPVVAAVPGANILELGDWGIRPTRWEDLHLVGAWRRFLAEPAPYFRHLLAD